VRVERGGGSINLFVPVQGPPGWDPTGTTAELALVIPGTVPASGDWHGATWDGEEARYLWDPVTWQDGDYHVKVRLSAGQEQVVLSAGRVTLG
jgi:hypothetical protein